MYRYFNCKHKQVALYGTKFQIFFSYWALNICNLISNTYRQTQHFAYFNKMNIYYDFIEPPRIIP